MSRRGSSSGGGLLLRQQLLPSRERRLSASDGKAQWRRRLVKALSAGLLLAMALAAAAYIGTGALLESQAGGGGFAGPQQSWGRLRRGMRAPSQQQQQQQLRTTGPVTDARVRALVDAAPTLPGAPLVVGCLSSPRTASTLVFNLARVLMERVDPNAVTGWVGDAVLTTGNYAHKERQRAVHAAAAAALAHPEAASMHARLGALHSKVSVVYKSHTLQDGVVGRTDFYVLAYRDPWELMCSVAVKFNDDTHLLDDLAANDTSRPGRVCERFASEQRRMRRAASGALRGALHINSAVLRTTEGVGEVVRTMAEMWGVVGTLDVAGVVAEARRLHSPPEGVFDFHHPRTLMHASHDTHVNASASAPCTRLIEVLSADEGCRAWHEEYQELFKHEPIVRQEARVDALGRSLTRPGWRPHDPLLTPELEAKQRQQQQRHDAEAARRAAGEKARHAAKLALLRKEVEAELAAAEAAAAEADAAATSAEAAVGDPASDASTDGDGDGDGAAGDDGSSGSSGEADPDAAAADGGDSQSADAAATDASAAGAIVDATAGAAVDAAAGAVVVDAAAGAAGGAADGASSSAADGASSSAGSFTVPDAAV